METHIGRDMPPYAILSHTWEDEEVTLQDWNSPTRDMMKGYQKIRMTCRLAASEGIEYAWVDTCCIDKTNSAELSEAINSMYRWYKSAKVCYTYLSDLRLPTPAPGSTLEPDLVPLLRRCRWFSRGWTLQELIAPFEMFFYEHDWRLIGKKEDWIEMLSDVTGISSNAIYRYYPKAYSIAERMSWAGGRETTREEDMAYCLLGLFDVNMPMLYGEGAKAFRRLQEEIIRTGYDMSIFAWTRTYATDLQTRFYQDYEMFAKEPGDFHSIPFWRTRRQWDDVSVTNAGLKMTLNLCLVPMPQSRRLSYVLPVCTGDWQPDRSARGIRLKKMGPGRFVRNGVEQLVDIPGEAGVVRQIRCPDAYILTDMSGPMFDDLARDVSYKPHLVFPSGCRVVKAWPPGGWNDEESTFMMFVEEPSYGSLLVEVQSPSRAENDEATRQIRTGEFMFLFSSLPYDNARLKEPQRNLQYTIVGYREHQLELDIINLRMGTGDMDVGEMRRTLRNSTIPIQRTATVPIEGTEQNIHTLVDYVLKGEYFKGDFVSGDYVNTNFGGKDGKFLEPVSVDTYFFKSWSVASKDGQQP